MNLLLINPPEAQALRANLPGNIEEFRGKNPPIGLLYLAAAARQADGWRVTVIDAHAEELDHAALTARVAAAKPDVVGIGATTFTYRDSLDAARAARRAAPGAAVVFGGVQPFLFPGETLAQPEVDVIFSGEAEASIREFLRLWPAGGADAVRGGRVPGVLVKGEDAAGFAPAPPIEDLDALPPPAWELSPTHLYSSLVTHLKPVSILLSSRGCPYRCRYCALSPTGKRWRAHSPARVIQDMRGCVELGARYLLFYDETFTIRRERVREIAEAIAAAGIATPWLARATPDTVDEELLRAMRRAHCDMVTFGVEAADSRVLATLGRREMAAETVAAFRAARRVGLRTIAYFMVGNPGETRREIAASARLARRLDPDMVHAAVFMPYPGSKIYEAALADGRIARDYWREFVREPGREFTPPYGNERLSDAELETELARFYRRFAFRPAFIWRRLRALRSWADVRFAWRAARRLLAGFD